MMFRLDRYHKGVLLGCAIFLSALMFFMVQPTRSTPLTPATWTVNTFDDPGAPTCAVTCSLRTAVNMAAPGDLIVFDASVFKAPLTITLQGQIEIAKALTIDGAAGGGITPTISGNHLTRTFQVDAGASVTLNALNIVGGQAPSGGGIYNSGWLTITDSTLSGNATDAGGPYSSGGAGGGIFNSGTLFLTNSIVRQNQTGKGGDSNLDSRAGTGGSGGGIFNSGTLFLTNSIVRQNQAGKGGDGRVGSQFAGTGGSGGGIFNSGTLFLTNSIVGQNQAGKGGDLGGLAGTGGSGGGIFNSGTLTITNGLVSENTAGGGGWRGGGLNGYGGPGGGIYNAGTLYIINSTLSQNKAGNGNGSDSWTSARGGYGGSGGGVYNEGQGSLFISDSNVSGNAAGNGGASSYKCCGAPVRYGGAGGHGGGIYCYGRAILSLTNTTVSDNLAGNGGSSDGSSYNYGGRGGNGGGVVGDNLSMTNVTIAGNKAGNGGAGYVGGDGGDGGGVSSGSLSMTNGTIAGNKAGNGGSGYAGGAGGRGGAGGSGGGVNSGTAVSITNSTLSENATGIGASGTITGANGRGAGIWWQRTASIMNTIIANGSPENNCAAASLQADGGYNLDSGNTCGFTTTNHSLVNTDPLLGVLGNYGGPVQTVPLRGGSPAMDAIPLGENGCGTTITTDARGVPRPQGIGCDIGASEQYYDYDLSLTPSAASLSGLPGSIVTFTLAVTNVGHTHDTLTITVAGNTFVTAAPASIGPLAAGAGTTFDVAVTIPGVASVGSHDTAHIQVTSQGDPTKLAAALLTTTVLVQVYLPLIINQP